MTPPDFPPRALREALEATHGPWSLPSPLAENGVHSGYRQLTVVGAGVWRPEAEPWRFVLEQFEPVYQAWLSWIDAGGFILPHRDAGPWRERWQVPISAAGDFHAEGTFTPRDGRAFQVTHWLPHSVTNDTDRPRIHLVIDRDVWLDHEPLPFAVLT